MFQLRLENIRLFRNHRNIHFRGSVHESVDESAFVAGTVKRVDIPIHHYQFLKGEAFQREKQLQYLAIYERNFARYPNQARAHRDIASISYTFLKDYRKAVHHYTESLRLNPNNVKSYVGLAASLLALGEREKALTVIRAGLRCFPENPELQRFEATVPSFPQ